MDRSRVVKFPEKLPAGAAELKTLKDEAATELHNWLKRHEAGEQFSEDEQAEFEKVYSFHSEVTSAHESAEAESARRADLFAKAAEAVKPPAEPEPAEPEPEPAKAEQPAPPAPAPATPEPEPAAPAAPESGELVAASARQPVSFAGASGGRNDIPAPVDTPDAQPAGGLELLPSCPNYRADRDQGLVSFATLAERINSVARGNRRAIKPTGNRGGLASQELAMIRRPGINVVKDYNELLTELNRLNAEADGPQGLVASGGWCAPSEQIYSFCDPVMATDLISLPEIGISRGGIIFPTEPDVSALLSDFAFQFYFTEAELEAEDGNGDPTAIKELIEIECPDDMVEHRLNAIGYGVKGGILQNQAWPELTAWWLQTFAQAHLRGVSWRTINDMVAGSGVPIVTPTDAVIGATSSVLNALEINAMNLRLKKGLSRTAVIEVVAPSWLPSVIRSDLAMREGLDALAVSDGQILEWMRARNIAPQFVADWQARGVGQPGHLDTKTWPGYADVIMYPRGTWFRSMSEVITLGAMYPIEQVTVNRFTHMFTEDAILVAKRCDDSIISRMPLCVNGAVGAREQITCSYTGVETLTATVTITGTPTGGTWEATLGGQSTDIAHNASAAQVKTALVALDDSFLAADFTTTGGALPGTPVVVTYPAELGALTVDGTDLTGGTSPAVTVS